MTTSVLDLLGGLGLQDAAGAATDAALAQAAARPFLVTVSLDDATRQWLTATAAGVVLGFVVVALINRG